MSDGIVHIVGAPVRVGHQLRQRCAWCGALILDYDLTRLAVHTDELNPVGVEPATWPAGDLVEVNGRVSVLVPHRNGSPLPAGACASIDPAATV